MGERGKELECGRDNGGRRRMEDREQSMKKERGRKIQRRDNHT